jgi:hypothetical protein
MDTAPRDMKLGDEEVGEETSVQEIMAPWRRQVSKSKEEGDGLH